MAGGSARDAIANPFEILDRIGAAGDLSDSHLLQRFLLGPDATSRAAFGALLERHGPMVLRSCRLVLGNSHDAQDAFQATFLVLARKAGSTLEVDSLAGWLHGVALRVSTRARADAARRRAHERRAGSERAMRSGDGGDLPEGWPELHEEIARLPRLYREPIVLCYLEGLSTEAAAIRIGCPRGTILSRLSRGRDRLRDRLSRKGRAQAAGFLDQGRRREIVPAALLGATARSAARILTGAATAGPLSTSAVSLTEGVLRAMWWTKLKAVAGLGLTLAALLVGARAAPSFQETRTEVRATPPGRPPEEPGKPAARQSDASTAVFSPMPPPDELRRLLRDAATEARELAKAGPEPSSWDLPLIAAVQARVGDLDGGRATFADAVREARGEFGGGASSRGLCRVGHSQLISGLNAEARATMQLALEAVPEATGDFGKDREYLLTLASIVRGQAALGDREGARWTAGRVLVFAMAPSRTDGRTAPRDMAAPEIAAALAAIGDFAAAFAWSEAGQRPGMVLGAIAMAASDGTDREAARKVVREVSKRFGRMNTADALSDPRYFGMADLAEAEARLGDVEAAKRSARAIGEGPSSRDYDTTDGQIHALVRVAGVQRRAGDAAGARETLRDALRSVGEHPKMRGRDERYGQVAGGQIIAGDIEGAIGSIRAMAGRMPEKLAYLARAQAARGELEAARATFAGALGDADRRIEDRTTPDTELADLAWISATAGDVPGSLRALRSIFDETRRRFALERVVTARAEAGDVAGALRLGLEQSRTPEERRVTLRGMARGVETRLSLEPLGVRVW